MLGTCEESPWVPVGGLYRFPLPDVHRFCPKPCRWHLLACLQNIFCRIHTDRGPYPAVCSSIGNGNRLLLLLSPQPSAVLFSETAWFLFFHLTSFLSCYAFYTLSHSRCDCLQDSRWLLGSNTTTTGFRWVMFLPQDCCRVICYRLDNKQKTKCQSSRFLFSAVGFYLVWHHFVRFFLIMDTFIATFIAGVPSADAAEG